MEPISAITAALVAGATAAASGTASQAVNDAYQGLKTLLVDGYKLVSTALLEKKPSNPAYQKAVEDELKESAAVVNDKAVLEKTQAVHDALRKEFPLNSPRGVWTSRILKRQVISLPNGFLGAGDVAPSR